MSMYHFHAFFHFWRDPDKSFPRAIWWCRFADSHHPFKCNPIQIKIQSNVEQMRWLREQNNTKIVDEWLTQNAFSCLDNCVFLVRVFVCFVLFPSSKLKGNSVEWKWKFTDSQQTIHSAILFNSIQSLSFIREFNKEVEENSFLYVKRDPQPKFVLFLNVVNLST